MGYILSEEEYNALDSVLTGSRIGDYLLLSQKNTESKNFPEDAYDYFHDLDEGKDISLTEGLQIVYEGAVDYKECYHMTDTEIDTFDQLLIKMGIKTSETKLV